AQTVVVRDTLDPSLDFTTLEPVFMTHKGVTEMDELGRVTFTFNNINLPPASTQPFLSNGMLTYKVKLRTGLGIGTQIRNRASIYFDFNAPVMTGSTLNTIGTQTYVNTVKKEVNSSFIVYPNPAGNS